jgi:hypothetical protein
VPVKIDDPAQVASAGCPRQFSFGDQVVEIGTNLIVGQFFWRLMIVLGQAFDSSDVATARLLCKAIKLHAVNEFRSDFAAHKIPPWLKLIRMTLQILICQRDIWVG